MIEIQIKDKKAARITAVCLLVSLVILAAVLAVRLVQWKDYVPVDATVRRVYTLEGTPAHPNDRHTEVTYSYYLNGQEYMGSRTERFHSQSYVGQVKTIRCNPQNPEMLEDSWGRSGLTALLCGGTFILVLLVIGLRQQRTAPFRRQAQPPLSFEELEATPGVSAAGAAFVKKLNETLEQTRR